MKKLLIILVLVLLYSQPHFAHAEILFQDDFESGPTKWSTKMGDSGLWKVENGKLKFNITTPSTFSSVTSDSIDRSQYIIEFDYTPISGEDKNISFRWNDNLFYPYYDIHFINSGGILSRYSNYDGWPKITNFNLANNSEYHFKIILDNQIVKIFINDNLTYDFIDTEYVYNPSDRIGLWATTGSIFPTEVWFDNIKVSSIDEEDAELDVPLFKQTSEPWQSKIYDTATTWSPINPTINRWGCALTSAVMVLRYHGILTMPNGQPLDPDSLNAWLVTQEDGYISNGLVNWIAISRLSKLSKDSGNNPDFNSDALEYTRFGGSNIELLTGEINNGRPAILQQPGHFIVAKGISGDTFSINDPFYPRTTLSDTYDNNFISLGQYRPSNTDLSYIMLTAANGIHLELIDGDGNSISDEFLQDPITDPITSLPSGSAINTLYLQQPLGGSYTVKLSSTTQSSYALTTYVYDVNGNVKVFTNSGNLQANVDKTLPLIFDKENVSNSSMKKDVTFQSIIEYINNAIKEKKIHKTAGKSLILALKSAEKTYKNKKSKLTKIQFSAIEALLHVYKKTNKITPEAYTTISTDLKELAMSLK